MDDEHTVGSSHEIICFLFRVGSDESIPVPDNSTDLVTCAQSVHWFDYPIFCKEADRVLTPHGCIALYGYGVPVMHLPEKDEDKENQINAARDYVSMGVHFRA